MQASWCIPMREGKGLRKIKPEGKTKAKDKERKQDWSKQRENKRNYD